MSEKEYIIFCDESEKKGKYYSNFYGGLIVGSLHYERVTLRLNAVKQELNLFGEIKKIKGRFFTRDKPGFIVICCANQEEVDE